MASRTLVISNPPHGTVNPQKAAPVLGLIPVETNLKVHYRIPEIWLAEEDPEAGIRGAEHLTEAGARVVVTSSDVLAAVPNQRRIHKFAFGQAGLRVLVGQGGAEIPYEHPIIGVHCVPRLPTGGGDSPDDGAAFLDLYLKSATGLTRLSLYTDLVDYSGLGDARVASHSRNMAQFMERLTERFTALRLDTRLVNMQLRRRLGSAPSTVQANKRRGYSFATPGLDALLKDVAPGLADIGQSDWSSRLVYLTLR